MFEYRSASTVVMSEDGDESKDNDEEWLFSRSALLLATVLIVGIAGTGVLRRLLGEAGLNDLGVVVWTLGYGGTVAVVWFELPTSRIPWAAFSIMFLLTVAFAWTSTSPDPLALVPVTLPLPSIRQLLMV